MDLFGQAEELGEAHHERTPALRIDTIAVRASQNARVSMDTHDPHLEREEIASILREWVRSGEFGFHLQWAFGDERCGDQLCWLRCESGLAKLVGAVSITHGLLVRGDGIRGSETSQAVDEGNFIFRREIDGALARAEDVLWCLGARAEAKDAVPSEPPSRGDRGDVRRTIGIDAAYENDGGACVQDRRIDGLVWC